MEWMIRIWGSQTIENSGQARRGPGCWRQKQRQTHTERSRVESSRLEPRPVVSQPVWMWRPTRQIERPSQ